MDISRYRSLFPYLQGGLIYLNHAASGPLSTRVVEAMQQHLKEGSEGPIDTYFKDLHTADDLRSMVARLVNAESSDRIAFTGNTSDGLNILVSGLPWKDGDRILLNDMEFPANVYPYLNLRQYGVEIDTVPCPDGQLTLERLEQSLRPTTRAVAISAVQFLTGYRADLAAIGDLCRSRGVLLLVDAIQAVGAVRLDVQAMKIDGMASGGQKWLMAPHGTGFLYLSQRLQGMIRQQFLGWFSVAEPWHFREYGQPLAPSARRYEGGTLNYPGLIAMRASVETLLDAGTDAVEERIHGLIDHAVTRLEEMPGWSIISPRERDRRAGIVTVRSGSPEEAKRLFDRALQRKAVISLREGLLRFSPHFYNTTEEFDEVLARMVE